jgi:hypothetical protein
MIPVGYMAKVSCSKPERFIMPGVADVYSVGSCVNEDFADYIDYWRHNGYWLFDSPAIIQNVAKEHAISLEQAMLFYYEAYEMEFTGEEWRAFYPEPSMATNVVAASQKTLEGFDVVTFFVGSSSECSPLSCNRLADEVPTNEHCLIASFDEAKTALDTGKFNGGEPGPYRIFAVYSVDWP